MQKIDPEIHYLMFVIYSSSSSTTAEREKNIFANYKKKRWKKLRLCVPLIMAMFTCVSFTHSPLPNLHKLIKFLSLFMYVLRDACFQ